MSRTGLAWLGLMSVLLVSAASAYAQTPKKPDEVTPNTAYGPGGTRTGSVEVREGVTITNYDFKDAKGVLRERHHVTKAADGTEIATNEWFDEKGQKTAENGMVKDKTGHYTLTGGATFKDGQQLSGESWEHKPDGTTEHTIYNPKTGKYEPADGAKPKETSPIDETDHLSPPAGPDDADLGVANNFYLGAAFVIEDSANTFLTYGFDASYTHAFQRARDARPEFGLMGDVQWTRGTDEGTTYTKLQALGGLEWCEHAWGGNMYFGAHALAGISHVTSEYNGMSSYTGTSFAIAAGFDAGKKLNEHSDVQLRVDYNPTFRDGSASNNVRISGGWRYRF